MGRAPCCEKSGLKKGPWTAEEDQMLRDYIQKHGHGSWRLLPKNAGLARCGKSCRLRWTNYLRPDIKRGRFSFEEEETIIQLHKMLGNKWSAIASHLPGRTDNEIKNYWNTHIRKRLTRMGINPVTHTSNLDLSPLCNPNLLNLCGLLDLQPLVKAQLMNLAASLLASHCQPLGFVNQLNLYQQQQQQQQQQFPVDTIPTMQNLQLDSEAQQLQNQIHLQLPPNANTEDDKFLHESQFHSTNFNLCNNNMSDSDLMTEQGGSSDTNLDTSLYNLIAQSFSFDGANDNQNNWCCNPTSVLSTPSSSSNNLSSPSAYINTKSSEDERDNSCNNLFGLQIPDLLDVSDYL